MAKKSFILVLFLLVWTMNTSSAQSVYPVSVDALTYSQTLEGFATARAAAMGGAMASLGGDISSLSYNPAGLAMYRNSEFVFTPQIHSIKTNATYQSVNNMNSSLARFNASVGGVVAFGRGGDSKHKFNLGFAYNRLKDFSGQYTVNATNQTSMADLYAQQLTNAGIGASTLLGNNYPFREDGQFTNAILAFQSGMIDSVAGTTGVYTSNMTSPVQNTATVNTSGYIDEYAFSGGYSYNDKLFLGLTIGLQGLYYYQNIDYLERSSTRANQINELLANGIGVNVKLGVAYKVTDALRLGFAFHSPTFYSINQTYMASTYFASDGYSLSPTYRADFNFNTPYKFIVGASYNILKRLTISADYQAALYKAALFRNYIDADYLNNDNQIGIKNNFQNTSSVRVGVEWNAVQWKGAYHTNFLFLRGGYSFVQSPFTKTSGYNGLEEYNIYTAGIGYKGGIFFTDFAFFYSTAKNIPFNTPNNYDVNGFSIAGTDISPKTRNMNFMLTIGFRF